MGGLGEWDGMGRRARGFEEGRSVGAGREGFDSMMFGTRNELFR